MSSSTSSAATLSTVAEFPEGSFLENLVVRSDNSVLITVLSSSELWYVPAPDGGNSVQPQVIHTFDTPPMGIVEVDPDIFYVCLSDIYTTDVSRLARIDLSGWTPGEAIEPEVVLDFPGQARGLNGACLIAPRVMLVADCFAGLIWRVDLPRDAAPTATVWCEHESMGYFPGTQKPEQPGVNGIGYAGKVGYLYYTCTAKKLFMRVRVNPVNQLAVGEPEHVNAGRVTDDFCIDEDAGLIYAATHRENTIDVLTLDPAGNTGEHRVVAGEPVDTQLLGPSSGRWRRGDGDYGKVAYFTTDGGTTAPVPGIPGQSAKLLLVEF